MRPLPVLVAVLLVIGLLPAPGGAVTRTTAVLDRFEGDRAVLVTDGEQRLVLPRSAVPPAGRHVDAVFRVTLREGRVIDLRYRPEESRERARRAQARFDRLAEDPDGDDPDADAGPGPDRTLLTPRTGGCLRRLPSHRPAVPGPTPVRARPC
jgi:hypothetical protein